MLFGGSSWSEVPISSLTFRSFNGDEFHFGFIIDTELGLTETIDQVLSSNKIVDTVVSFDGKLDTVDQFSLSIDESTSGTLI